MQAHRNEAGLTMDARCVKITGKGFEKILNFLQKKIKFSRARLKNKLKLKNPIPYTFIIPVLSNKKSVQRCQTRHLKFELATEKNLRSGNKAGNL